MLNPIPPYLDFDKKTHKLWGRGIHPRAGALVYQKRAHLHTDVCVTTSYGSCQQRKQQ
ncbi:hypothetical protein PS850_05450 [Pseudomonas fluorescens]|nr:hypothetical protein PS850_05450 [Pseudomonas fluorescens]